MKREKKWDKAQKLRALVVDLNVAVKDMEEYNNVENDEFYMLPSIVLSVCEIVYAELRKVEAEEERNEDNDWDGVARRHHRESVRGI